jgi:hypothetical protein
MRPRTAAPVAASAARSAARSAECRVAMEVIQTSAQPATPEVSMTNAITQTVADPF